MKKIYGQAKIFGIKIDFGVKRNFGNKIFWTKQFLSKNKGLKKKIGVIKLCWSKKMLQSGVSSMQVKDTGNMPSAVCVSSMNKSLDPTPI